MYLKSSPYSMNGIGLTMAGMDSLHPSMGYPPPSEYLYGMAPPLTRTLARPLALEASLSRAAVEMRQRLDVCLHIYVKKVFFRHTLTCRLV